MKKPFIIGVAGGTASGKTTVCEMIMKELGMNKDKEDQKVIILHQDSFYKALSKEEKELANNENYNFDHPNAFDYDAMLATIDSFLQGKPAQIPIYDFKTHSREAQTITISPPDVILFEGILVLYSKNIRDLLDMKLFVDTDSDTRLSRRVLRDIQERNRSVDSVLKQYLRYVKPAFDEYILPTKKYADVIIPRGSENSVAINLISQHIKKITDGDESTHVREIFTSEGHEIAKVNAKDLSASRPH